MKRYPPTAAIMLASAAILTACSPYSEGERTGAVNKLSYKGYVCKSYEGEMLLGGLRNRTSMNSDGAVSTSVAANIFEFSVADESVVADIKAASRSGKPLTLTYDQFALPAICGRKTGYVITGVTYVTE